MSGNSNRGGHNKTHGKYEDTLRIDSYMIYQLVKECKDVGTWSYEWVKNEEICAKADITYSEDGGLYLLYKMAGKVQKEQLQVEYVPNHYGGNRMYFICPVCGKRVRFLCASKRGFVCRVCAGLNYHVQQSGKEEILLDRIIKLLHALEVETVFMNRLDIATFNDIEKPRYMRNEKFSSLMLKLLQRQEEYWDLQRKTLRGLSR